MFSLRQREVLVAMVNANWAQIPCFYYKINIGPEEMQNVEIILFVSDELMGWLQFVKTIISYCSQKQPGEIYGNYNES